MIHHLHSVSCYNRRLNQTTQFLSLVLVQTLPAAHWLCKWQVGCPASRQDHLPTKLCFTGRCAELTVQRSALLHYPSIELNKMEAWGGVIKYRQVQQKLVSKQALPHWVHSSQTFLHLQGMSSPCGNTICQNRSCAPSHSVNLARSHVCALS